MTCRIARVFFLISLFLSCRHGVRITRARLSTSGHETQSSGMAQQRPGYEDLFPQPAASAGTPGRAPEVGRSHHDVRTARADLAQQRQRYEDFFAGRVASAGTPGRAPEVGRSHHDVRTARADLAQQRQRYEDFFAGRVASAGTPGVAHEGGVSRHDVRTAGAGREMQSSGMAQQRRWYEDLVPQPVTSEGTPGVAHEAWGSSTLQPIQRKHRMHRSSNIASTPGVRTQVPSANESELSDALSDVTPSSPFYYNANGTAAMKDDPKMAHWTETLSSITPGSVFFEQNGTSLDGDLFSFYVVNEATLPVNFMALSSKVKYHASVTNGMLPGEETNVPAALVKYGFFVSVSDKNGWRQEKEILLGMAKNFTTSKVGHFAGAAVSGKVAAAVVSGLLSAVLAPPVAATLGLVALTGTGMFTSMAISRLCEGSWDMLRGWVASLVAQDRPWPVLQANGLFRFKDVVTELDVQLAFASAILDFDVQNGYQKSKTRKAMPQFEQLKILEDIVMTQGTAEAYYAALQAVFSDERVCSISPRRFVIAGGFTLPRHHEFLAGVKIVDFTPLSIAEDLPNHGCTPRDGDDGYWTRRLSKCKKNCGRSVPCERACEQELSGPLQAIEDRMRLTERASALKGRWLFLIESPDEILIATRSAGIRDTLHDHIRLHFQGRELPVHSVNVKDFTAVVRFEGQGEPLHVLFPLEVLQESGFTSVDRMALNHNMYGECWSRYSGGVWNGFRRTFSDGSWCYARRTGSVLPFGQVCFPADQEGCGNVETDSEWECVPGLGFSA